jgi:hypothetical protein
VAGSGCYDVDGQYADGCECCADAYGKACNAGTQVSLTGVGVSSAKSGVLPVTGQNAGDWFEVTFDTSSASRQNANYHPQIRLTGAAAGIVFSVFSTCNGAAGGTGFSCGDGPGAELTDRWEQQYDTANLDLPANNIWTQPPANGILYVEVYRASGTATTCADDDYTLTFSE